MKIIIIEKDDSIQLKDNIITFSVRGRSYSYFVSEIDKITLMLNDIRDDGEDMSLSIRIGENTFIVPSEYGDFEDLLLNGICISLDVDMVEVTKAFSCTEKSEFVIYKR